MQDINDFLSKNKEQVVIVVVIIISLLVAKNIYGNRMRKCAALQEQARIEKEKGEVLDQVVLLNERAKVLKGRSWDTIDSGEIIQEISKIGHESNIKIIDLTPETRSQESYYSRTPLSLNCQATYKDLLRFIKALETHEMFTRVVDFRINAQYYDVAKEETQRSEIPLVVNLKIEAIYLN